MGGCYNAGGPAGVDAGMDREERVQSAAAICVWSYGAIEINPLAREQARVQITQENSHCETRVLVDIWQL